MDGHNYEILILDPALINTKSFQSHPNPWLECIKVSPWWACKFRGMVGRSLFLLWYNIWFFCGSSVSNWFCYFVFLVGLFLFRRFPVVERKWHLACKRENESLNEESLGYSVLPLLPTDAELATAFVKRKNRFVMELLSFSACLVHFVLNFFE